MKQNRLIRGYFLKGTDFKTVSKARLKEAQNQLHERLNMCWIIEPKEVFEEMILNKSHKNLYLPGCRSEITADK